MAIFGQAPSLFAAKCDKIDNAVYNGMREVELKAAMYEMGIPEDKHAEVLEGMEKFDAEFGYTVEEQIALVRAAITDSDKEQLYNLLSQNYYEVFNVDPEKVSAEMLKALSDHASILALNNQVDELVDYINGMTSVQGVDTDPYPERVIENYSLTYLAHMSAGLETVYISASTTAANQIVDILPDGTIIWAEPQDVNSALAGNADRLGQLLAVWEQLMFINVTMQEHEHDLVASGYMGPMDELGGFSIDGLTFQDNGIISYDWQYQVLTHLSPTDDNVHLFADGALYTVQDIDWANPDVSSKISGTSREITVGQYYDALQDIEVARDKAYDKLCGSSAHKSVSLISSLVPGGSAASIALKETLSAIAVVLKYMQTDKVLAKDVASMANELGVTPDDLKAAGSLGKGMFDLLDSQVDYRKTLRELDAKEVDAGNKILEVWFGQGTQMTLQGRHGLTPEDSINATGNALIDNPDYKHGQVVYLSMAGNDYRTLYGMNEWQSRGAEFLLNEGTDGNYSQEDIYGRSSNSVLGQMVSAQFHNEDIDSMSEERWHSVMNEALSDEMKLILFGNDPANLTQHGVVLKNPDITLSSVDPEEFNKANTFFENACADALDMHTSDANALKMFEESIGQS